MLASRCASTLRYAVRPAAPSQLCHIARCLPSLSWHYRSRPFVTTPRNRYKDETRERAVEQTKAQKTDIPEGIAPETVGKPKPASPTAAVKKDPLLAEKVVSVQEQRKADWAIIKEMSAYLWPKVGFVPGNPALVMSGTSRIDAMDRTIWAPEYVWEYQLRCLLGQR